VCVVIEAVGQMVIVLGIASPMLGLIASGAGLNAVFLASAIAVLCAAVVATALLRTPRQEQKGGRHKAARGNGRLAIRDHLRFPPRTSVSQ